jgi:hypothetical protein
MTTQNRDCCLNCQAELVGPFCSQCGQAESARLVPMKVWLGNVLGAFIDLDSKVLRTLKRLFLQPGQPTLDFARGQRVPYSGPVRIYIIVSAISIAAMTLHGVFTPENADLFPGMDVNADFKERVQFLFPFVNLLSPLLTACILAVFQRGVYFQLHLAFSLHFWTFLVAVGTPPIFIPSTSIWALVASAGLLLIFAGYLFVALGRVYAMPIFKRLLMCSVLLVSLPITTLLFTLLLFVLAAMPL